MSEEARCENGSGEVFDLMRSTRAMRRLRPDPVPKDVLLGLVRSASWGPSASNGQGHRYVIVTDRDTMARLAPLWRACADAYLGMADSFSTRNDPGQRQRMEAAIRYQRDHFEDIPALIFCCYGSRMRVLPLLKGMARMGPVGVLRSLGSLVRSPLTVAAASIYPGVQNLLLAARARGLGATLTCWHLSREREWKKALGVPRPWHIYAIVPVGWPMGNFGTVRRRPVEEITHWEAWGSSS